MAVDVLVVQHGEKERVPGDPGLTPTGRAQAAATARWLATNHRVDELWSSPLRRAVETARPIAELLDLDPSTDDRLRERMNWASTDEELSDFLDQWARANRDRAYRPPGGDSSLEAAARFVDALDAIVRRRSHGTVVVVAHGGVTVDTLRTLAGDERVRAEQPELIDDGVPCCAITSLHHDGRRWNVKRLPTTRHLDSASPHRPA